MAKKQTKKTILKDLLTNPLIDPQELQERLFFEKEEISSFIKNKQNQKKVIKQGEENIKGFWGSILRAVLQKGLEGDTQALKLLFEYAERRRLTQEAEEKNLSDTTEEERKILAEQMRERIEEIRKKLKKS